MQPVAMKKIFVIILLACISSEALPQDFVFKVILSKGSVGIKSDSKRLKIGSTLKSGDRLVVGPDSYVGLMHNTGQTIEITKPGEYAIDQITSQLSAESSGITSRIVGFVLKKISKFEESPEANYKENIRAVAGVSRATDGQLTLLLKESGKTNKVYGENIILRWFSTENAPGYVTKIMNSFGEELTTVETDQEFIQLDLESEELGKESFFIVQVSAPEIELKSGIYQIQRVRNSDEISDLQSALNAYGENNAMHALMLATFYEDRRLYLDALSQYERAMQLSPDQEFFRVVRDQFIINNSLGR